MKPLTRTKYRIIQADVLKYLRDYQPVVQRGFMPKYSAVIGDAPYALESIVKRFGKQGSAAAVAGNDGAFQRLSKGFMGQEWDGFGTPQAYQAWVTSWAELLLDFVYPGAVLLMFGGSRTYHRLACGLEDAGWEIYDSIANWTYGSGMPKRHDLGNGYDIALKPANEPLVLARAPRKKFTYKHCLEQFGTSGLNIDACRIPATDERSIIIRTGDKSSRVYGDGVSGGYRSGEFASEGRYPANFILNHHPECGEACHPDCHVVEIGRQSGHLKSGAMLAHHHKSSGTFGTFEIRERTGESSPCYADEGSAARFFYQAKPANWEKAAIEGDIENTHPTLKPIQLTTYLASLIKSPIENARLLNLFSGSGSEMIGGHLAGWRDITGIEMTADYIPIAKARLAWWTRFETYAEAEAHYKQHDPSQMTLFEQPKKAEKQVYQPSLFELEAI
jgi:site-specific DNA-methyltransferase (adenine-specific)